MADDEVFDEELELIGETRDKRDLVVQHFQLDDHVSEKLSLGGVGERALIVKLVDFADVVQESTRQKQIAIHVRIQRSNGVAESHQRNYVLQQAADEGMMQRFCGG